MESNESIEILKNIHTRLGWGSFGYSLFGLV